MEYWIKRVTGQWVGPYPTWETAQEDLRLLGFLHATVVRQGPATVKAR